MLKNAHDLKVPLTFSTDADYWVQGKTRGEVAIEFIETWKAAGIPAPDILRAMTTNGYKVSETEKVRGPIKAGLAADLIAVEGNPLENIDTLRACHVRDEGRHRLQARRGRHAGEVLQSWSGEGVEDSLDPR